MWKRVNTGAARVEGMPASVVPAPQTLTNPVSAPSPGSGLKRGHCTEQPQQDRTYYDKGIRGTGFGGARR